MKLSDAYVSAMAETYMFHVNHAEEEALKALKVAEQPCFDFTAALRLSRLRNSLEPLELTIRQAIECPGNGNRNLATLLAAVPKMPVGKRLQPMLGFIATKRLEQGGLPFFDESARIAQHLAKTVPETLYLLAKPFVTQLHEYLREATLVMSDLFSGVSRSLFDTGLAKALTEFSTARYGARA